MNDLTHSTFGAATPANMSSREIAELTGKRHDHVMRDVRNILVELHGETGLPRFGGSYLSAQNKRQPEYLLPKRETLILVSGYSVELRARIIDRWQELEEATMLRLPQDFSSALRALADKTDELANAAPKIAFAEQIAAAPDAISIGQAAKILGTGRNRLCSRLREMGWMTRVGEPYQSTINAGLLDVKIGSWEHPEKGLQRSVTALVTGKGLAKLHLVVGGSPNA